MSVSQKINHLTHTLLYCIRSWGHPLPTCAKKSVSTTIGLGDMVSYTSSGNPPTKVNGKYSFWPILCNPAPNTQPCYIASVCGGLTLLFLEKNPDLFPPDHATEISQLKLMGNVGTYPCYRNLPTKINGECCLCLYLKKKKRLTHTLLYCIRSWGHPIPTFAKKSVSPASAHAWSSVTTGSYTCIWKSPN